MIGLATAILCFERRRQIWIDSTGRVLEATSIGTGPAKVFGSAFLIMNIGNIPNRAAKRGKCRFPPVDQAKESLAKQVRPDVIDQKL